MENSLGTYCIGNDLQENKVKVQYEFKHHIIKAYLKLYNIT